MRHARPLTMGAAMGLIMLWMIHGIVTGDKELAGPALVVFVLAHIALPLLILGLGLFAARMSPRFYARLPRLRRRSLPHIATMSAGAAGGATLAHVVIAVGAT